VRTLHQTPRAWYPLPLSEQEETENVTAHIVW